MFLVLRPLRFLARALTRESTPRQLACGFALGLMIGLVPKGNLIAVVLMTLLCSLRINLGMGMLAAFAFSWVGVLLDPLTHSLGNCLLTAESLTPLWTWLYDLPVVPWTAFNNTVVFGSTLLGLLLLYPAYRISEPYFEKYTPVLSERLRRYRPVQLLWGAEIADKLGGA